MEVDFGAGAYPYASVVDNRTGDPTTIPPKPETLCRLVGDDIKIVDEGHRRATVFLVRKPLKPES